MNREDIFRGVCECLGEALDMDPGFIKEDARVISDLGADSLDLLDLVFRLEQRFKIKISPRDIERRAQEKLGDRLLAVDGVYTPEAIAELRLAMPEVPEDELAPGLRTAALPRSFRVGTFINLVERLYLEQNG